MSEPSRDQNDGASKSARRSKNENVKPVSVYLRGEIANEAELISIINETPRGQNLLRNLLTIGFLAMKEELVVARISGTHGHVVAVRRTSEGERGGSVVESDMPRAASAAAEVQQPHVVTQAAAPTTPANQGPPPNQTSAADLKARMRGLV